MNKDLCDRAEKGLLWFDDQQFKAKKHYGSLEYAHGRLKTAIEDASTDIAVFYRLELERLAVKFGRPIDSKFFLHLPIFKNGKKADKKTILMNCAMESGLISVRPEKAPPDGNHPFGSKKFVDDVVEHLKAITATRPTPLDEALSKSESLPDLIQSPAIVDNSYLLQCHMAKYAEQLSKIVAVDLICSDETELLLLDSTTATDILNSNNTPLGVSDLQYIPFDRTFIEFDKTIELLPGIETIAAGLLKSPMYSAVCWFHDTKVSEKPWDNRISTNTVPYTGVTIAMFTMTGKLYAVSNLDSMKTWQWQLSEPVKQAVLTKSRNLWDFVTCRNIDYEVRHRGQINCTDSSRPKHLRSKVKLIRREYRIVKVEGKTVRYDGVACNHNILEYQISIPGTFHKWIYCKECGDIHRHDLIGCPCRKCGLQVGPIANITVKKFWHGPHLRGPADAPFVETARELIRK